ncbi:hypothetical protein [Burkholderia sp. Cy-637]|uniref:hypothetical protein n=1 Tax=Burkholderia sp. Cy-637 TaxID=2608327 RepID=UPI001422EF00|nr:hypothetical protein [Burkholderia sp. Cy-637]NIF91432.1 hypothetical protein [Burkholderia sp. Cy-637]
MLSVDAVEARAHAAGKPARQFETIFRSPTIRGAMRASASRLRTARRLARPPAPASHKLACHDSCALQRSARRVSSMKHAIESNFEKLTPNLLKIHFYQCFIGLTKSSFSTIPFVSMLKRVVTLRGAKRLVT